MASIEATLSKEEQATSALDDQYDTAVQNLQNAQSAMQTINTKIAQTKAQVAIDRKHLTNDAVKAYIYGTPQSNFAALFSSSATMGAARNQYTQQIVGNLDEGEGRAADVRGQPRFATIPGGVSGGARPRARPPRPRRWPRPTSRRRQPRRRP